MIAGLDNFCWPDPVQSASTPDGRHKLAQTGTRLRALYDVCLSYDIPLISGKDSMKNDYRIGDTKISIPPTILFTAAAILDDVRKVVSMEVKGPDHVVYVLGETRDEMGVTNTWRCAVGWGRMHHRYSAFSRALYERLNRAIESGLVASCHDVSDGGLGRPGRDRFRRRLRHDGDPVAAERGERHRRAVQRVAGAFCGHCAAGTYRGV